MATRVYDYAGPPRVAHEGHLYLYNVIRDGASYEFEGSIDGTGRLRVLVSGGSMGGLFTALALQEVGHDVAVYERTTAGEMRERGAGIIAHPQMFDYLEARDLAKRTEVGNATDRVQWLSAAGDPLHEEDMRIWTTSWDTVYRCLRGALAGDVYHMGHEVVEAEQDSESVTVRFADGGEATGDLLVDAEGYRSTTRQALVPSLEPRYAGYVAWRGTVPEADLEPRIRDRLGSVYTLFHGPATQMLTYPVPGPSGEVAPGERRINWVWYVTYDEPELEQLLLDANGVQRQHSLPPGLMRESIRAAQVEVAESTLPPVHAALVGATAEPFIQNIYDLGVDRMVYDRICVLGDAAFFARPHTGSGTAKAAADGFRLAEALAGAADRQTALAEWEASQLRLGQRLLAVGRDRGDRYTGQF